MEAMENAIENEIRACPATPQEEPKVEAGCSCYNQVASTSYWNDKVQLRQISFNDALRFLGEDQLQVAKLSEVLAVAKQLETYYLEGKTLADTVK